MCERAIPQALMVIRSRIADVRQRLEQATANRQSNDHGRMVVGTVECGLLQSELAFLLDLECDLS